MRRLWEYASEEGNPGNHKHVSNVLVCYPSPRLREGVVFVDTPGVGSLAAEGGAEALAYLPRCDVGVVLVDAASSLDREDLALLRSLYEAGVSAMVLVSKANLLTAADRDRLTGYVRARSPGSWGSTCRSTLSAPSGPRRALLDRWFDGEISPLLARHREVAEASLRRKTAGLREAVTNALEALLEKQGRGAGGRPIDGEAARLALDEADRAVREARALHVDWPGNRTAFLDALAWSVAQVIAGAKGDDAVVRFVSDALLHGAKRPLKPCAAFPETLIRVLDALRRAIPCAGTDTGEPGDRAVGGLPVPTLGRCGMSCSLPGRSGPRYSDRRPRGASTANSRRRAGPASAGSPRSTTVSSRRGPGPRRNGSSAGTSRRPECSGNCSESPVARVAAGTLSTWRNSNLTCGSCIRQRLRRSWSRAARSPDIQGGDAVSRGRAAQADPGWSVSPGFAGIRFLIHACRDGTMAVSEIVSHWCRNRRASVRGGNGNRGLRSGVS